MEKEKLHKFEMVEGKRNVIQMLLQEYDIESVQDIQDALKVLLGGIIKEMMEAEMDAHLIYGKLQRLDSDYNRNGCKKKQIDTAVMAARKLQCRRTGNPLMNHR